MLSQFIRDDGENFIFTGHYMEMYIPNSYFDNKLAENFGTSIKVFGIFNIRLFDNNMKGDKVETLNIPTFINIYPSEIDSREIPELSSVDNEDGEPEKYLVAKFYNGGIITKNVVPQDATNVELFLNILCRGNIPVTIPYTQILSLWQKNLELNGVKLGVPSVVLEIIISEIYRDKHKPEFKFAKTIGKNPSISPYEYQTANIREICARNSTFAALTFEDMDSMITTSLNINKFNKKETESPIEKIIKM